jgi:hypothetical protein
MNETIELVEIADDDLGAVGDSSSSMGEKLVTVGVQAAVGAGIGALVASQSRGNVGKGAAVGAGVSAALALVGSFFGK